MPEYLAPGVYVEEIPSANKPIAAASTSTSAMVGMTERGPVGRPTLVTSAGDFARKYGGTLDGRVYGGGLDMLPYAAEGFFGNGGSRLYVVRVAGAAANEAELRLTANTGDGSDAMTVQTQAASGQATIMLSNAAALSENDTLLISNGDDSAFVTVGATALAPRVSIGAGLGNSHVSGAAVREQTATDDTTVVAISNDDVLVVTVADAANLAVNTVVRLTVGDDFTFATITAIDTNDITFAAGFDNTRWNGAQIAILADGAADTTLAANADASGAAVHLEVADTAGMAVGDILRIGAAGDANTEFAIITAMSQIVTLSADLQANHARGVTVRPATEVATVHAISPGVWGDQLRVRTAANALLVSTVADVGAAGSNTLTLSSAIGLYPGSVVLVGNAPVGDVPDTRTRHEVTGVDVNSGVITLSDVLAAEVAVDTPIASQEFAVIVERVGRDGKVAETELFENLSLAAEHPRYALDVIGHWDVGRDRPEDAGASALIRMSDRANATTRILPMSHGVMRSLAGGNDDIGGVNNASFIGTPSNMPNERTGIEALRNRTDISLVSVPGRTDVAVHKALLNHCEAMRYRFAVLETPLGANFDAAQTYRQNFDNTRCAIYYPGLTIADPYGPDGATRDITPSGHMMGLYARVDNTRGVHKAPANEVVRGILRFEEKLTKGEQDILNPKNLNCFRDFRDEFRGLRVYGARVATSDPEWRYINVRRLLLMIEQSLDTGLQWAVFEPNEKPLWDTVKQSVTGFLNTVWRSGALEGQTQEEAFFVNIGYGVTMTQDDIDNGRMIVEIGVAPVKPAEYVIARISQKTREATG